MSNSTDAIPRYTQAPRPPRGGRLPKWLILSATVGGLAAMLLLALAARARVTVTDQPRIQPIQDMAFQPKYRPQSPSDVFADGRAMRPAVPGIVARGRAEEDDHYHRGFHVVDENGQEIPVFYDGLPEQVKLSPELLARGQQRFDIYCAACHGRDGLGTGPVHQRAMALAAQKLANWTPPSDLTSEAVRVRPDGHLYNTINVGIRSMPAHGPQIPVADRWAIVAYVRALQLSRFAPASAVPAGVTPAAPLPTAVPSTQPTAATSK